MHPLVCNSLKSSTLASNCLAQKSLHNEMLIYLCIKKMPDLHIVEKHLWKDPVYLTFDSRGQIEARLKPHSTSSEGWFL